MTKLYECIKEGNPHPVVSALVRRGEDVLMVLRGAGAYEDYWALPGGIIDKGEEPEAALFRELLEETGVVGTSSNLISAYRIDCKIGLPHTSIDIVYQVTVFDIPEELAPTVHSGEVREVRFVSVSELPAKIAFGHRAIIEEFVRI